VPICTSHYMRSEVLNCTQVIPMSARNNGPLAERRANTAVEHTYAHYQNGIIALRTQLILGESALSQAYVEYLRYLKRQGGVTDLLAHEMMITRGNMQAALVPMSGIAELDSPENYRLYTEYHDETLRRARRVAEADVHIANASASASDSDRANAIAVYDAAYSDVVDGMEVVIALDDTYPDLITQAAEYIRDASAARGVSDPGKENDPPPPPPPPPMRTLRTLLRVRPWTFRT